MQKIKNPLGYPEVITNLPEADIRFEGVKAWILQGAEQQLVFFEMQPSAKVPEHSHDYSQWGIMIDGEMELTIDDEKLLIKKGDEYVIPTGAKHHAAFHTKCRIIDLFTEKARYRAKTT